MAYGIVGSKISGLDEKFSSHKEATAAAADRAGSGGQGGAIGATQESIVALEFEDALEFVTVVDIESAMQSDVDGAVDEDVDELLARSPDDVQSAHQQIVKAKRVDEPFAGGGTPFPVGSWVVDFGDRVASFTHSDFEKSFSTAG